MDVPNNANFRSKACVCQVTPFVAAQYDGPCRTIELGPAQGPAGSQVGQDEA